MDHYQLYLKYAKNLIIPGKSCDDLVRFMLSVKDQGTSLSRRVYAKFNGYDVNKPSFNAYINIKDSPVNSEYLITKEIVSSIGYSGKDSLKHFEHRYCLPNIGSDCKKITRKEASTTYGSDIVDSYKLTKKYFYVCTQPLLVKFFETASTPEGKYIVDYLGKSEIQFFQVLNAISSAIIEEKDIEIAEQKALIEHNKNQLQQTAEDFEDIRQYLSKSKLYDSSQHVYLASNQHNRERNIFKIGITTQAINKRLSEYGTGRSKDERMELLKEWSVSNAKFVEHTFKLWFENYLIVHKRKTEMVRFMYEDEIVDAFNAIVSCTNTLTDIHNTIYTRISTGNPHMAITYKYTDKDFEKCTDINVGKLYVESVPESIEYPCKLEEYLQNLKYRLTYEHIDPPFDSRTWKRITKSNDYKREEEKLTTRYKYLQLIYAGAQIPELTDLLHVLNLPLLPIDQYSTTQYTANFKKDQYLIHTKYLQSKGLIDDVLPSSHTMIVFNAIKTLLNRYELCIRMDKNTGDHIITCLLSSMYNSIELTL